MGKNIYCFVDSSNLFYGGAGRLNWKIDYEKLYRYFKKKYRVKKVFYYTGIETHGFGVELRSTQPYPAKDLLKYLNNLYRKEKDNKKRDLLKKDIARIRFLVKIKSFGYILRLKPIKHIRTREGGVKSKANCDVDLTFDAIRLEKEYSGIVLLSGDGDFEILLKYFREKGKSVVIIANAKNTARSIKENYTNEFRDFEEIRNIIEK